MKTEIDEKLKIISNYFKKMGCKKIWLFGSYAENTTTSRSDIDIAISGISTYLIYKALAQLPLVLNHSVDLVNYDELPDNFKNSINKTGRLIYGS